MMIELIDGNQEFAYCLIKSLSDTTISHCEFSERVFALSDYLHFQFCGIDCQDPEWIALSEEKKFITRQVITTAYNEYRSSSLFMSKIDNLTCEEVVDIYSYCKPELIYNKPMKKSFKESLERIYKECQ